MLCQRWKILTKCYQLHLIRMSRLEKYTKILAEEVTHLGGIFFSGILFLLVFLLGYREFSFYLLLALVIGTAMTFTIRTFYHKDRPKRMTYLNFFERIYSSSFPSMHVIRTGIYVTLFTLYFESIYFFIIFLGVHILVFWSRYYLKKHHLDDLIFGTFFGIAIPLLITYIA